MSMLRGKWSVGCSLIVLCLFLAKAGWANTAGDFVILRFDGTKLLPHESQLTLGKVRWETGATTSTRVSYILVCDRGRNEVYCYARESLWRIDTAAIDKESEFMRIWCDSGVLAYVKDSWQAGKVSDLWILSIRAIFADVFDLPIDASRLDLVESVYQCADERVFRGTSKWDQRSSLMRHRSVAVDGNQVVVNLIQKENIISAVRADRDQGESHAADCKAITFRTGKPWEIRQGRIEVKVATELPGEIQTLLVSGGTSVAEKWSLAKVDGEQGAAANASVKSTQAGVLVDWKHALLIFCIFAFGFSVVFRSFLVSKGVMSHEEG